MPNSFAIVSSRLFFSWIQKQNFCFFFFLNRCRRSKCYAQIFQMPADSADSFATPFHTFTLCFWFFAFVFLLFLHKHKKSISINFFSIFFLFSIDFIRLRMYDCTCLIARHFKTADRTSMYSLFFYRIMSNFFAAAVTAALLDADCSNAMYDECRSEGGEKIWNKILRLRRKTTNGIKSHECVKCTRAHTHTHDAKQDEHTYDSPRVTVCNLTFWYFS